MAKTGILKEALKEAKSLRRAALKNAENSLSGHFRGALEEVVNAQLNEEADGDSDCDEEDLDESLGGAVGEIADVPGEAADAVFGEADVDGLEDDTMTEEFDMFDEEEGDLDLDGSDEPELDEDGNPIDEEDEVGGFSEEDLNEVVRQVLDEVDHGQLGEPDDVTEDKHDSGLLDQKLNSRPWEEEDAPAKKDWTVGESKRVRRALGKALIENKTLKKVIRTLREAVKETNLFNRKMFYAHKLLGKQGLKEGLKMKIVKKLDKARSAQEVENIYESIEMAFGLMSENARKVKKTKKATALSEALGYQPRTDRGIAPKSSDFAHLLNEDAKYAKRRMQIVAGIINPDNE